jgi:hypothetical protein
MSQPAPVSLSVRQAPIMRWGYIAAWIVLLLLGACAPVSIAPATPSRPVLDLAASSAGVCQAIVALPDVSASRLAFTNLAHDALHGLAADPLLARATSARVLEAMQRVEADFSGSPDLVALTDDLAELDASTDMALQALGEEVPACVE